MEDRQEGRGAQPHPSAERRRGVVSSPGGQPRPPAEQQRGGASAHGGTAHGGAERAPTPVRRILLAGGRQLWREGLRALLATEPTVEVVGLTTDRGATEAGLSRGELDVVVVDHFLGAVGGGAKLAIAIRERHPDVGVVLLLGDGGDPTGLRAVLEQGASRRALLLLDHPRCATDLVRAIHEVADGGSMVHPGVLDLVLGRQECTSSGPPPGLTPRERQVLEGIASGASNRTIGLRLGLSERAVEKHINQLYSKLGVSQLEGMHRRVAAARIALGAP